MMLTENAVIGILQSCIAGAGLVLAIYALILPVLRRLFKEKSKVLKSMISELRARTDKVSAGSPQQEFRQIAELGKSLEKVKGFPKYVSAGMMFSFVGYLLSALLSMVWLLDWYRPFADFLLPYFFIGTTVGFLMVGIISIRDAYSALKQDLDSQMRALDSGEKKEQD
jgi:hypothetical protein